jgi:RNA polymerase sigma factor (sigma-70 family)
MLDVPPVRSEVCLESLALRIAALEDKAFAEFAHVFGPQFKAMFLRRGATPTEADDLAASCVTDIALKVDRYRSTADSCFRAWVLTLARNAFADWCRRHRRELSLDSYFPSGRQGGAPAAAPAGEEVAEKTSAAQAVEDALRALPEVDRAILEMRYSEGEYAFADIARLLASAKIATLSPDAVRVRHHRLLRQLAATLERDPRLASLRADGDGQTTPEYAATTARG